MRITQLHASSNMLSKPLFCAIEFLTTITDTNLAHFSVITSYSTIKAGGFIKSLKSIITYNV